MRKLSNRKIGQIFSNNFMFNRNVVKPYKFCFCDKKLLFCLKIFKYLNILKFAQIFCKTKSYIDQSLTKKT